MGSGQKNFKLVWRCHQLLSGFLVHSKYIIMQKKILCKKEIFKYDPVLDVERVNSVSLLNFKNIIIR